MKESGIQVFEETDREKLTRTLHQYSRQISPGDMDKLREIAGNYAFVKNYVYRRYSGVKSLQKLWPGYTVQNEMTSSGIRMELGLPVSYFYPAIFDALANIKAGWKQMRREIAARTVTNQNFTEQERHYICYILKNDRLFTNVVSREAFELPEGLKDIVYGEEGKEMPDRGRLHNYICRQVRRNGFRYQTRRTDYFQVTPKGYRYGDDGIYLATKEQRKRIFLPLTDHMQCDRQLTVSLKADRAVLYLPKETAIRHHQDYKEEIALAFGYEVLFTTCSGHQFGEEYGARRSKQIDLMRERDRRRKAIQAVQKQSLEKGDVKKAGQIEKNNLGSQKYIRWKEKQEQAIKSYINAEIQRLLQNEKPAILYVPKLGTRGKTKNHLPKKVNAYLSGWQKGYVRERLSYQCRLNGIILREVEGAGVSTVCSRCGETGKKKEGLFYCDHCGRTISAGQNTAENIYKAGHNKSAGG